MRYILIILTLLVTCSSSMQGQSRELAYEYFRSGEFEKSADLFKKLYKSKRNVSYFDKYIESLIAVQLYDEAEKALKDEIKAKPKNPELYVTYGSLMERKGETDEAESYFAKAIESISGNGSTAQRIGISFNNLAKYEYAIKAYEKGAKLQGSTDRYASSLANLYFKMGNKEKMIYYYLDVANKAKSPSNTIRNLDRTLLEDKEYDMLQEQLYERIQEEDSNPVYVEMLTWTFINRKQYRKAFRQARSLDRQNEENGGRVYEIAMIAYNDGDYNTANEAFRYIIKSKGQNTSYYLAAKTGLLLSERQELSESYDFDAADFDSLRTDYISFLDEFGRNRQTADIMIDYAELEAKYLNNLTDAISTLNDVVGYAGVDSLTLGDAKLQLADYMLMDGDVWESTLLYSQVDKQMKEAELGEKARFRNAMLSYYRGDFEWAQEQFGILKHATSRLISNDAIDMAVFIMDNLGLDTTAVPLQKFANADLLMFQNRYTEAFAKWDSIEVMFPEHGLADDILFKKAKIFVKQKKYDEAIAAFDIIVDKYKEEIKADNALYELAKLYEGPMKSPEKAREMYQRIILDFSDSTFAIEARNKYEELEPTVAQ